jgi:starch synthase
VPVVARVGGLADTVIDASSVALAAGTATGIQFAPVNETMLESAIRRAAALYRTEPQWARLQRNGMATDVSWAAPARAYAALYHELIGAA